MKEKILERIYEIEKSKEIICDDKEKQILKQIEIFNSLYDCMPWEQGLKLYMLINDYKEKTEESNKEWFKKGFMIALSLFSKNSWLSTYRGVFAVY